MYVDSSNGTRRKDKVETNTQGIEEQIYTGTLYEFSTEVETVPKEMEGRVDDGLVEIKMIPG